MRCVLWNVQWAAPGSRRLKAIAETIRLASPDVICLTEATTDFPFNEGHAIFADADYGYGDTKQRRKVLLWSRSPWSDVSIHADRHFPTGRIVSGTTQGIRFLGVCVPWSAAHVSTGRRDRKRWEDHGAYLRTLAPLVEQQLRYPLVLLGDFNQAIPRHRQPTHVYAVLEQIIKLGVTAHTQGRVDSSAKPMIDHVMTNGRLGCTNVSSIPRHEHDLTLSDHDGIAFDLTHIG